MTSHIPRLTWDSVPWVLRWDTGARGEATGSIHGLNIASFWLARAVLVLGLPRSVVFPLSKDWV